MQAPTTQLGSALYALGANLVLGIALTSITTTAANPVSLSGQTLLGLGEMAAGGYLLMEKTAWDKFSGWLLTFGALRAAGVTFTNLVNQQTASTGSSQRPATPAGTPAPDTSTPQVSS